MTDDYDNIDDETDVAQLAEEVDDLTETLGQFGLAADLKSEEKDQLADAIQCLYNLNRLLESRADPIESADLVSVAETLDGVYDLSGDIMSALEEVRHTIDQTGWPHPNPYDVADTQGGLAQDRADTLLGLAADQDDTDSPRADGGDGVPQDVLEGITGYDWKSTPRHLNTNGTDYVVGWGDHGYFDIVRADIYEMEGSWHAETVGDLPIQSFSPDNIDALIAAIEEGR